MGRQRTRKVTAQPEQQAESARTPEKAELAHEGAMVYLQRTIGNRALTRMLRPESTNRVRLASVNGRVQRTLIDGATQEDRLNATGLKAMDIESYVRLASRLTDYATLMKRSTGNLAGQNDQEKGEAFYAEVDAQLIRIADASQKFLDHRKHEGLNTEWLRKLVESDIPETRGAARWVQHNAAAYPNTTYLDAMTAANTDRKARHMNYVQGQLPLDWPRMTDAMKQLLAENRDSDAARVAAIQEQAGIMLNQGSPPRDVLRFLADGAEKFVVEVVRQYVAVANLREKDLAVVKTGSFGAGMMFPYSDVDVQVMTSDKGKGKIDTDTMILLLHNIRMRVRGATMRKSAGQWQQTEAWDADQLVGGKDGVAPPITPKEARERDGMLGLAQTRTMAATQSGATLPGQLKKLYADNRKADAREKAGQLAASIKDKAWILSDASRIDNGPAFDFKDRFITLSKIFLNVAAMWYGLEKDNSWERLDELNTKGVLSPGVAGRHKRYLDITSLIRLKYQYFYQAHDRDVVSPHPNVPVNDPEKYPKGYYTLTEEDRGALREAHQIQQEILEVVNKLQGIIYGGT